MNKTQEDKLKKLASELAKVVKTGQDLFYSLLKFVDPLGLISQNTSACGTSCLNGEGKAGVRHDKGYKDA
jgi:hypothetical protein